MEQDDPAPSNPSAEDRLRRELQEAGGALKAGRFDEAADGFRSIVRQAPALTMVWQFLGVAEFQRGRFDAAVEALEQAIAAEPGDPQFLLTLGTFYKGKGDFKSARDHFQAAIKLAPDNLETIVAYAETLILENLPEQALPLLEKAINIDPFHANTHLQLADLHERLQNHCLKGLHLAMFRRLSGTVGPPEEDPPIQDAYYLDRDQARRVALQNNRIQLNQAVDAPQLCFHGGAPFDDAPRRLIAVEPGGIQAFFMQEGLRRPQKVIFPPDDRGQLSRALAVAVAIDRVERDRRIGGVQALAEARRVQPAGPASPANPLRVFLATSRQTTVMQYATRDLARAMARAGCAVRLLVEEDDRHIFDSLDWMRAYIEFRPHATINVNHLYNDYLHEDIFNVSWWQDPMPEITAGKPLPWRQRDIVLSAYPEFDALLEKTGAPQIHRQDFCVDADLFRAETPLGERRKILFTGTAHANFLRRLPGEERVIAALRERFSAGESLTDAVIEEQIARSGLEPDYVRTYLTMFVVRDTAIEWLCEMAPELAESLGLDVEIHGRFWDKNPVVAPYFKGVVAHGPDLVRVYNEARYVLSPHPRLIQSQRLAEAAACGCIPVINDDRALTEPPHWDDEILFFKGKAGLRACFEKVPPGDPAAIGRACSFDVMAARILRLIKQYGGPAVGAVRGERRLNGSLEAVIHHNPLP